MECIKLIVGKAEIHHELLKIFFAIIGGSFALYQYWKNSNFQRIVNLQNLWKSFYNDPEFMDLFAKFDSTENNNQSYLVNLENVDPKIKLRFLAYLAEVYNLANVDNIDKEKAIDLFQWHFYYIFINEKTKYAFWNNLIPADSKNTTQKIDMEIQMAYWHKYYLFAKDAEKVMKNQRSV